MSQLEFCVYRVNEEPYLTAGSITEPIRIESRPARKCLVLEMKGIADKTCYNHDLGTFSCPIAQEAIKSQ